MAATNFYAEAMNLTTAMYKALDERVPVSKTASADLPYAVSPITIKHPTMNQVNDQSELFKIRRDLTQFIYKHFPEHAQKWQDDIVGTN